MNQDQAWSLIENNLDFIRGTFYHKYKKYNTKLKTFGFTIQDAISESILLLAKKLVQVVIETKKHFVKWFTLYYNRIISDILRRLLGRPNRKTQNYKARVNRVFQYELLDGADKKDIIFNNIEDSSFDVEKYKHLREFIWSRIYDILGKEDAKFLYNYLYENLHSNYYTLDRRYYRISTHNKYYYLVKKLKKEKERFL